jgi:hypothetical protein
MRAAHAHNGERRRSKSAGLPPGSIAMSNQLTVTVKVVVADVFAASLPVPVTVNV